MKYLEKILLLLRSSFEHLQKVFRNNKILSLSNRFPVLLGCALLSFSFLLLATWKLSLRLIEIRDWKQKILTAENKLPLLESLSKREKDLLTTIHQADPRYLENKISLLRLCRLEAYSLASSKEELNEVQQNRFQFLMSQENTLRFHPGKSIKGPIFKTYEMKADHTVEVDETDIPRLLTYLEGLPVGSYSPPKERPPIIIKKLSLKRKKETKQSSPSYLLDVELWCKEATKNP